MQPGTVLWRFPNYVPGQDLKRSAIRNCVAIDEEGRAYAAIGHKLFAFTHQDGAVRVVWQHETGGKIPGSPAIGRDGRIRVHSGDGKLHCLTASGDAAWEPVDVGEPLGWPSPVVDEDCITWICGYEGGLIRVAADGVKKEQPYFSTRQKFDSNPLVHRGFLYVGAEDGFIYAIRLDGPRGKNTWNHLGDKGKTDWFINSSPALTKDEVLIVAGRDEYLYAFDLSGDMSWRLHIRGQMLASPVIDSSGDILVGVSIVRRGSNDRGKLVAVDGRSHRVRWEYETLGAIESTPVIGDDGLIYFGDNSGTVYAVSEDGSLSWRAEVGHPVRSAGAMLPECVLFGIDDGTLVGLACTSTSLAPGGWPKYTGTASQSGLV